MRINKYWLLDKYLNPVFCCFTDYMATKEQYNSVTIIHYGRYFRPIILTDNRVIGLGIYRPKEFYKGVYHLLSSDRPIGKYFCGYDAYYNNFYNVKKWGCREFTDKQLKTIKETMEWHFTKEQLGLR